MVVGKCNLVIWLTENCRYIAGDNWRFCQESSFGKDSKGQSLSNAEEITAALDCTVASGSPVVYRCCSRRLAIYIAVLPYAGRLPAAILILRHSNGSFLVCLTHYARAPVNIPLPRMQTRDRFPQSPANGNCLSLEQHCLRELFSLFRSYARCRSFFLFSELEYCKLD